MADPNDKPLPLSDVRDFLNDDDDFEEDEYERASQECGEMPGGFCTNAGTEFCDFMCPFRDDF